MLPLKLTKNFTRQEIQCPCCHVCNVKPDFMDALQKLRDEYGKPMKVTSGFRCASHNKRVKGAETSQHLFGNAVDIACENMFDRFELVRLAIKHGFTGVECSAVHVHLDRRTTSPRLMLMLGDGKIA